MAWSVLKSRADMGVSLDDQRPCADASLKLGDPRKRARRKKHPEIWLAASKENIFITFMSLVPTGHNRYRARDWFTSETGWFPAFSMTRALLQGIYCPFPLTGCDTREDLDRDLCRWLLEVGAEGDSSQQKSPPIQPPPLQTRPVSLELPPGPAPAPGDSPYQSQHHSLTLPDMS